MQAKRCEFTNATGQRLAAEEPPPTAADPPVIPPERADDLHHLEIAGSADLVLFMAGNQFMAMEEIIGRFQAEYPEVEKIFYETLPPGLALKQILAHGAVFRDRILTIFPDIYTSVDQRAMQALARAGRIQEGDYHVYLHNRLTLMVPPGNPARIRSVADLGRDEVRISQPDPENEDIARHILNMYRQAGGDDLVQRIMTTKRAAGTTILTRVHHRETPLRLAQQTVDVGPVWATEAIHAHATGRAFEVVEPGAALDQRDRINYYVCRLAQTPRPANAQKSLDFLRSSAAQNIYRKYGFVPHSG
ncbi:MAG: substrate-binding domain-containing protein [Desulfobacterales bacterium]|nr:MAG: substrate-binding domain-containing protein [Desulfobacterales bacterium]